MTHPFKCNSGASAKLLKTRRAGRAKFPNPVVPTLLFPTKPPRIRPILLPGLQSTSVGSRTSKAAEPSGGGQALAGFLLSGFLMALLGRYPARLGITTATRRSSSRSAIIFCAWRLGIFWPRRLPQAHAAPRVDLSTGLRLCALACVALVFLALVSPPVSAGGAPPDCWRLGFGAGLLNMALFQGHFRQLSGRRRRHGEPRRHLVWAGVPRRHPAGRWHVLRLLGAQPSC